MRRHLTCWLCVWLCLVWMLPAPGAAQQAGGAGGQAPQQAPKPKSASGFIFTSTTELVLVNLTVKDSHGDLVKNLKKEDVSILEDGKPQSIASFDFEDVDAGNAALADNAGASAEMIKGTGATKTAAPKPAAAPVAAAAAAPEADDNPYRDRRLMVIYFDLTTMQPEDVQAGVESAQAYVKKQMQPADLVAIAALGNSLQVVEDFTADKDVLLRDLDGMNPASSSGFSDGLEAATDGSGVSTDGTVDDGSSFQADDTEFNVANADRSLEALMTISQMLAPIQQKKSLLYISDGIQRSGTDNELTLRSAVNAAVKANVSIYTMDARGLMAAVPGGAATAGSTRGSSSFSGSTVVSALNSTAAQQETLQNLSNDTGGASFLDSNDFAPVYTKVQNDTKSYYLIGYHTTNKNRDGKYRKITVKINRADLANAVVDARKGYYAPTDLNHMSTADRQGQLEDQLNSDAPDQALPVYASDGFVRIDKTHYWVPVALVIPGAAIPLSTPNPKAVPSVDFAGFVEDNALRQLAHINQTVQLNAQTTGDTKQLAFKNLQYNAGFLLTPGTYHIRMAARENQVGQMGSFETRITIPDLDALALKSPQMLETSSVLVGSQLSTVRPDPNDPLSASGRELVPSVTKVFASNQHLFLYFEVYNPQVKDGKINVKANANFFHGGVRTFQTPLVTVDSVTDPRRNAVVFQMDISLEHLQPGSYNLQVNAIDEFAQRFAFPRVPLVVRAPAKAGAAAATSSTR